MGNYKVSLLLLPGELLEEIVHYRVSQFWDRNEFLTDYQGGLRKCFSTVSTIADLTDDIFNQINKGQITLAALWTSVRHSIL